MEDKMGILVTQEQDRWVVGLREQWQAEAKDRTYLLEKLVLYKVAFSVDYDEQGDAQINMNDAKVYYDTFEELQKGMGIFLELKKTFGRLHSAPLHIDDDEKSQ